MFLTLHFGITDGKNFLHVHPMFLHSNATSHKWAFGGMQVIFLYFTSTLAGIWKWVWNAEMVNYFLLFAAIAELLDNAIDEVIIFLLICDPPPKHKKK